MKELPKICNRLKQDLYNLYKYVQDTLSKTVDDIKQSLDVEYTLENDIITLNYGKSGTIGYVYFGRCKGNSLTINVTTTIGKLPDDFKPKHVILETTRSMNSRNYKISIDTDGYIKITPLSTMVENAVLYDYVFFKI